MSAYNETIQNPEPPLTPPEPRYIDEPHAPAYCGKCGEPVDPTSKTWNRLYEWYGNEKQSKMVCLNCFKAEIMNLLDSDPVQLAKDIDLLVETYYPEEE